MDNLKYRIKVKTELSGVFHYYVQVKLLGLMWNTYDYGGGLKTLKEATGVIKELIDFDNSIKQRKIVKTKIINYGKY